MRGADGRFHVLEDNVRTPSGVSYVIENRRIMTRLMPELIRGLRVRSVENYPAYLLASLRELAPRGVTDPTVALLTPGPFNSAFFEHVFLSQQMGIELVEGRDLVCIDHKLFMKTVHGPRQIDVLYRRIDDDFLDPVVFRPDSLLGVAGLTAVLRAGNATLANAIGTGVADDKAVFAYTPAMIQYYLDEEPMLPIVETYLLRDPEVRQNCAARSRALRDQADRSLGRLWRGDRAEGDARGAGADAQAYRAAPADFIAQPVFQLSVHPTLAAEAEAIRAGGAARRFAAIRIARSEAASAGRRTDASGAARRLAHRQLLARRGQQGYLGAGRIVLRRIADSLFWAARYLERAQWRARLVDVNYHLLLEVPPRDG